MIWATTPATWLSSQQLQKDTYEKKQIFTESTYRIVKEMKFLLVLKNLSIVEIAASQKVMLITQKVMLRLVLPT